MLKSAHQSSKNGHGILLFDEFERRVQFYSEILFIGSIGSLSVVSTYQYNLVSSRLH